MKLKSIWQRFIAWITFDKTSNHHKADINHDWGKHYWLDTSYTQESKIDDDHVTLYGQAKNMARIKGITLEQAASQLNSVYRSGKEPITTTLLHTLDAGEEVISIKRDKMHELIEQKKNRKPFYKDGNKKNWE